jgi:capsular polysaccharide biosynthesis protein
MRCMAFGFFYTLMSTPPPLPPNEAKDQTPCTCRGFLSYLGVIVISFLLTFLTAAVITYVMPKKYESKAVIQILPSARVGVSLGPINAPQFFFATEFEVIKANLTLKPVVQKLDLATRWNMTEEEAIALLRGIVETQNIRGTDLIEIRVKHTNPEDARDIAREVFQSYKTRREDKERELVELGLKELQKAIEDQREVVEEKRKKMLQRLNQMPPAIKADLEEKRVDQALESPHQVMLDRMQEKLAMERINLKQPMNLVILHEEPVISIVPHSPNVVLNLALGAAVGILLGLFIALLMWLFKGRCKRCAG